MPLLGHHKAKLLDSVDGETLLKPWSKTSLRLLAISSAILEWTSSRDVMHQLIPAVSIPALLGSSWQCHLLASSIWNFVINQERPFAYSRDHPRIFCTVRDLVSPVHDIIQERMIILTCVLLLIYLSPVDHIFVLRKNNLCCLLCLPDPGGQASDWFARQSKRMLQKLLQMRRVEKNLN